MSEDSMEAWEKQNVVECQSFAYTSVDGLRHWAVKDRHYVSTDWCEWRRATIEEMAAPPIPVWKAGQVDE